MGRALASVLVVSALVAGAAGANPRVDATPSTSAVVAQFRKATGRTLLVDRPASYPGHYTALTLPLSIQTKSTFGAFSVIVVGSSAEEDVLDLLADSHTGALGTPGPSQIYWEQGKDLSGTAYWLAKKRYGKNVVLWWYGDRQKVDARFKRLHRALLPLAAAASTP